jgi:hypothetical protein
MTTMSIKTFLEVSTRLPVTTSVLLRGPHGIGKSQVVRKVASHFELEVIDRRLSQMTEGDMVGLPSTDGEVTRFNPPDWYKRACTSGVALFLDELNRGTNEVQQAAFQIVLDRELNGWKLHPQTRVFAAVNTGASYTVNEMDPALLDRFWAIDLTPTAEDFHAYAKDVLHPTVVEFLITNDKWLDSPKDVDPGKVSPSRRSWERLSHSLVSAGIADTPNDALFYPMCLGYVGTEATIAFHSFAKTIDNQVTGEEVLTDYGKVKKKVAKLGQEKQNVLIEKVVDYVKKTGSINESQGENLRNFMQDLPGELRISAWSKLTSDAGTQNLDLVKTIHKYCVSSVLTVFGVNSESAAAAVSTATAPTKTRSRKQA